MVDECCSCKKKLSNRDRGVQVLPHMNAFVCTKCANGKRRTYSEAEITNKNFPPWDDDQVKSVTAYQRSDSFLPFVCSHRLPMAPTADGFVSADCKEQIGWAYPWMLDWSWRDLGGPDRGIGVPKRPHPPSGEFSNELSLPAADEQRE